MSPSAMQYETQLSNKSDIQWNAVTSSKDDILIKEKVKEKQANLIHRQSFFPAFIPWGGDIILYYVQIV